MSNTKIKKMKKKLDEKNKFITHKILYSIPLLFEHEIRYVISYYIIFD